MKEFESFLRVGVCQHRSYYIPFAESDKIKNKLISLIELLVHALWV